MPVARFYSHCKCILVILSHFRHILRHFSDIEREAELMLIPLRSWDPQGSPRLIQPHSTAHQCPLETVSISSCLRGRCSAAFDRAGPSWRWPALETGRPARVKSEAIAKHVDPKSRVDEKKTKKTRSRAGGEGCRARRKFTRAVGGVSLGGVGRGNFLGTV